MAHTKTVEFKGRKVEAQLLEFETKAEPWNQYVLEDGTTLRMKIVLLEVVRLVGEKDEKGQPVYQFVAQQIIGASTPNEKTGA